jgi:formylglycine-generating enzyme required for sulfatase activity
MKHRLVTHLLVALLAVVSASAHAVAGLRVRCNVEGATVYLDGKAVGTCGGKPIGTTASAGQHRLVIEKPIDDDRVYRYQTELNLTDGNVETVDASLTATVTEDGFYRRGNDADYLQHYPNGKYAKVIQDKRRQAEANELRAQRERDEALRRAGVQQKEAQRLVEQERKLQASNWRQQFDAAIAKLGASWRDCAECPEMVLIPPGNFVMGSTDPQAETDEWPPHAVSITRAFALGKFAVTVGQYSACVKAGGCRPPQWLEKGSPSTIHDSSKAAYKALGEALTGQDQPIIGVSWDDARAYAAWLSSKTGNRYHLPSEAQWEYAARAGSTTPFYTGNCINTSQANFNGTDYNSCGAKSGVYRDKPVKVGSFPANAFGLHDMAGNVWQRLEDCYHDDYQGAPTDGSAWTVGCSIGNGLLRGGSWGDAERELRSADRGGLKYAIVRPGTTIGFRIARTLLTP